MGGGGGDEVALEIIGTQICFRHATMTFSPLKHTKSSKISPLADFGLKYLIQHFNEMSWGPDKGSTVVGLIGGGIGARGIVIGNLAIAKKSAKTAEGKSYIYIFG